MGKAKNVPEIRLPSFGALTGLIFEDGGSAEILMTWPELTRLLDAWRSYEKGRKKPDEKLMAALELLCSKARGRFNTRLVAEVPIAQWKAKITPILREG